VVDAPALAGLPRLGDFAVERLVASVDALVARS
jgi:hypothetical protein